MLKEGESHQEMTLLQKDLAPADDNVRSLYIWDPSGKEWNLSRRQMKRLRSEAKKFGYKG